MCYEGCSSHRRWRVCCRSCSIIASRMHALACGLSVVLVSRKTASQSLLRVFAAGKLERTDYSIRRAGRQHRVRLSCLLLLLLLLLYLLSPATFCHTWFCCSFSVRCPVHSVGSVFVQNLYLFAAVICFLSSPICYCIFTLPCALFACRYIEIESEFDDTNDEAKAYARGIVHRNAVVARFTSAFELLVLLPVVCGCLATLHLRRVCFIVSGSIAFH